MSAKPLQIVDDSPEDEGLLAQMRTKIKGLEKQRDDAIAECKVASTKIAALLKSAPKRPRESAEDIDKKVKQLEFKRTTTSMALTEEKAVIKEIEAASALKKEITAYTKFNDTITELKAQREASDTKVKEARATLAALKTGLRRNEIADKLEIDVGDIQTSEIDVPEESIGEVIGARGSKKREIENACGVSIDVDVKTGKCKIQGAPAGIARATKVIETIRESISEDIELSDNELRALCSNKGQCIHQIQDEHMVRLDLDRGEDKKMTGKATIRGIPDCVKAAKKAIKELMAGKADIDVDDRMMPGIIGKGGSTIRKLQEDSGARFDIDRESNSIHIVGSKQQVKLAVSALKEIMADLKEHEQELPIDPDNVSSIIGAKGETIAGLQKASGAKFDVIKTDPKHPILKIRGTTAQLASATEELAKVMEQIERENRKMPVSAALIPIIIGKGGETIKRLTTESGANITFDRSKSTLKLRGDDEALDKAEELIGALLKENEIHEIPVNDHQIDVLLQDKGAHISRLQTECELKLNLDKKNGILSARGPDEKVAAFKATLEELMLDYQKATFPVAEEDITLVIGPKGATIKELQEDTGCKFDIRKGKKRTIDLTGSEAAIEKAKAALDNLLNGDHDGKHAILKGVDDSSMGALIGKKGANLKELQETHEVRLDLLRSRNAIRIRGEDPEKVQECKAAIQEKMAKMVLTAVVEVRGTVSSAIQTQVRDVGIEMDISLRFIEDSKEGIPIIMLRGAGAQVSEAQKRVSALLRGKGEQKVLLQSHHMQKLKEGEVSIRQIADSTGCTVDFDDSDDAVVVKGPIKTLTEATNGVIAMARFFFADEFSEAPVPRGSMSSFIKGGRQVLNDITEETGVIASLDSQSSTVRLCGAADKLDDAKAKVNNVVHDWEKQNAEIKLEPGMSRYIIGPKGATINALQQDTDTTVKLDAGGNFIRIHGEEDAVLMATGKVAELMTAFKKEHKSIEVDPAIMSAVVGSGAAINDMQKECGLRRIDLDRSRGVVLLSGEEEAIEKATALIEERKSNISIEKIDVDRDNHFRVIVGKGGSTIRQIQDDTGVKIDILRDDLQCVLLGSKEDIEKAKTMIEELLAEVKAEDAKYDAIRAEREKEEQKQREKPESGEGGGGGGSGSKAPEDTGPKPKRPPPECPPGMDPAEFAAMKRNQKRKAKRAAKDEVGESAALDALRAAESGTDSPRSTASATSPKKATKAKKKGPKRELTQIEKWKLEL